MTAMVLMLLVAMCLAVLLGPWRSWDRLAQPIKLLPVTAAYAAPCRAGDLPAKPDHNTDQCYQFGTGMTLTAVKWIDVRDSLGGKNAVYIELRADDAPKLAALSNRLFREAEPRNQLAIVIAGRVESAPIIATPLNGEAVWIDVEFTSEQAHHLVDQITG
jgi:preprotein translocase subunit SecD